MQAGLLCARACVHMAAKIYAWLPGGLADGLSACWGEAKAVSMRRTRWRSLVTCAMGARHSIVGVHVYVAYVLHSAGPQRC